jgi:tetratricopeptide (TPR) repeat protein
MKKLTFFLLVFFFLSYPVSGQTTARDWFDKGKSSIKDKQYNDAVYAFRKSCELQKDYDEAWYELGWCYNELEKYEDAVTSLSAALKLNSSKASYYYELGWAYDNLSKADEAIDNYSRSLVINPNYSSAYKDRAFVYYDLKKDYEKALSDYKNYIRLEGDNITNYKIFYRKGWCETELELYDDAIGSLKKANQLQPGDYDVSLELGYVYDKKDNAESAIYYYKEASRIKPAEPSPYIFIGDIYRDLKSDSRQALTWYWTSLEKSKEKKTAHYGIGWCYNELENYDSAIYYLKKATALDNKYSNAYTELGYAYYAKGSYTAALTEFNRAIELNAYANLPFYYSGKCYVKLGQKNNALRMYEKLKPLHAANAEKLYAEISKM